MLRAIIITIIGYIYAPETRPPRRTIPKVDREGFSEMPRKATYGAVFRVPYVKVLMFNHFSEFFEQV